MDFSNFLFRCSGLGNLMTEAKGSITDKQLETLAELERKRFEKPLTANQMAMLTELQAKRDAPPELSKTTQDYLQEVFIREVLLREKDISVKYTEKGLWVEEDSLTIISRYLNTLLVKNKLPEGAKYTHSNALICGTPDAVQDDYVLDIKSSWDVYTFMQQFFGKEAINKMYYWQLQGYMLLTGKAKAKLAYCLVDTPEHVLVTEKFQQQRKTGFMVGTPEWDEVEKQIDATYTYGADSVREIPENKRVKIFELEANPADTALLGERIALCRNYLNQLNTLYEGI